MSAREELTYLVELASNVETDHSEIDRAVDAIIAAGYIKPRTITTTEELDALPVGSVVQSYIGAIYERDCYGDDPEFPWWCETADSRQYPSRRVSLPATVLYEPQP